MLDARESATEVRLGSRRAYAATRRGGRKPERSAMTAAGALRRPRFKRTFNKSAE
jgi:hypothetical protein